MYWIKLVWAGLPKRKRRGLRDKWITIVFFNDINVAGEGKGWEDKHLKLKKHVEEECLLDAYNRKGRNILKGRFKLLEILLR